MDEQYIPESITREGDTAGITVSKIRFNPEDIKKKEKMEPAEAIAYKAKLIEAGKYTLNEDEHQ